MLRSTAPHASAQLGLEALEAREVPAISILVDYSLDLRANGGSGFFETNAEARTVMNRVAYDMGQRVSANFTSINPNGTNSWTAAFYNPATGAATNLSNLRITANTIVVYVGGRAMPGGEAAQGGFGGYGWSGMTAWGSRVATRGSTGFATWGGSIAFDSTERWHYGLTTSGLDGNELDFYSVATHELGHVMGIGTATQWFSNIQNGKFIGSNARSLYGGPVPLDPSRAHWADGVTIGGRVVSLDPTMSRGQRVTWSSLDQAALYDIGWAAGVPVSPPAVPPSVPPSVPPTVPPAVPPTVPPTLPPVGGAGRLPVLVSGANGRVDVYARGTGGNLAFTGQSFTPFAGFGGSVRTAVADFNGDGITDYAFATGAGTAATVRVVNGSTGADLVAPTQVLGAFGGGVYIAAGDVNRDGKAELAVSADAGGIPAVELYRVASGRLSMVSSFLAFGPDNRRGARIAMGDIDRDGAADLVIGAGAGQLSRVRLIDGDSLAAGGASILAPSFVAFGTSMTTGMNVAVGDVNGDGYAEVITSQDAGGTSRVRVWSGATIAANLTTPASALPTYQNFFANGTEDRSGIRIVSRDINGDGKDELVTSTASGTSGWVRVLAVSDTDVTARAALFPFNGQGVLAGVYVG